MGLGRFLALKLLVFLIFELCQGFGEIRPAAVLGQKCHDFFVGVRIKKFLLSGGDLCSYIT